MYIKEKKENYSSIHLIIPQKQNPSKEKSKVGEPNMLFLYPIL